MLPAFRDLTVEKSWLHSKPLNARYRLWLLKNHVLEVRRDFIALGCPINDVLDFGRHFLPLGWGSFFKRGGFSTATPVLDSYLSNLPDHDTKRTEWPEMGLGFSRGLTRVVSTHSLPFMTNLNTTLSAVSCSINETISLSSSTG
jgi:hypothetical protein